MTTYEEKRQALEATTVSFSVLVIKTCAKYSKSFELRPLVDQIIRSSTSIGANYAEANNSSSKADFKNKIFIAKKEIAETRYWLRVLKELVTDDLTKLEQEALELNMIFQKVINTLKSDKNDK